MRKSANTRLSEADNGKTLAVQTGQEIELRLPENPTTGYRWHVVEEGEPVCKPLRTHFEAGRKPGEPGVHIRSYRVVHSGKATLKLVYARSWEPGNPGNRSFEVRFRNSPKPGLKRSKNDVR